MEANAEAAVVSAAAIVAAGAAVVVAEAAVVSEVAVGSEVAGAAASVLVAAGAAVVILAGHFRTYLGREIVARVILSSRWWSWLSRPWRRQPSSVRFDFVLLLSVAPGPYY